MQVVINMDDKKFDELFGDEVGKLDPREVKDIFAECIKAYFEQNNYANIERLITEKDGGYYSSNPKFTWFGKKLIESCDYGKLQEVVDKAIDSMIKNHDVLLKEVLFEAIASGFNNSYSMGQAFRDRILPLTIKVDNMENFLENNNGGNR